MAKVKHLEKLGC